MQVVMEKKLIDIDRSREVFGSYDGIVLRSFNGIDEQESVGAQTETREG